MEDLTTQKLILNCSLKLVFMTVQEYFPTITQILGGQLPLEVKVIIFLALLTT